MCSVSTVVFQVDKNNTVAIPFYQKIHCKEILSLKRGKGRNPILSLTWGPSKSPESKTKSALNRNSVYYSLVCFEANILLYEMKEAVQKILKNLLKELKIRTMKMK